MGSPDQTRRPLNSGQLELACRHSILTPTPTTTTTTAIRSFTGFASNNVRSIGPSPGQLVEGTVNDQEEFAAQAVECPEDRLRGCRRGGLVR